MIDENEMRRVNKGIVSTHKQIEGIRKKMGLILVHQKKENSEEYAKLDRQLEGLVRRFEMLLDDPHCDLKEYWQQRYDNTVANYPI